MYGFCVIAKETPEKQFLCQTESAHFSIELKVNIKDEDKRIEYGKIIYEELENNSILIDKDTLLTAPCDYVLIFNEDGTYYTMKREKILTGTEETSKFLKKF